MTARSSTSTVRTLADVFPTVDLYPTGLGEVIAVATHHRRSTRRSWRPRGRPAGAIRLSFSVAGDVAATARQPAVAGGGPDLITDDFAPVDFYDTMGDRRGGRRNECWSYRPPRPLGRITQSSSRGSRPKAECLEGWRQASDLRPCFETRRCAVLRSKARTACELTPSPAPCADRRRSQRGLRRHVRVDGEPIGGLSLLPSADTLRDRPLDLVVAPGAEAIGLACVMLRDTDTPHGPRNVRPPLPRLAKSTPVGRSKACGIPCSGRW